nr:hypothetical protein [Tanacetum cinerariifolium]
AWPRRPLAPARSVIAQHRPAALGSARLLSLPEPRRYLRSRPGQRSGAAQRRTPSAQDAGCRPHAAITGRRQPAPAHAPALLRQPLARILPGPARRAGIAGARRHHYNSDLHPPGFPTPGNEHAPKLGPVPVEHLWEIRSRLVEADPSFKHRISALRRRVLFLALEDAGYGHPEAQDLADRSFEVFLQGRHQLDIFPEV